MCSTLGGVRTVDKGCRAGIFTMMVLQGPMFPNLEYCVVCALSREVQPIFWCGMCAREGDGHVSCDKQSTMSSHPE